MSTDHLTAEDRELLARPLFGFLTTSAGPQPPEPRPVWFEATDEGGVQLFTAPDALRVRRLRRDPRASLLVATPVGEHERWVSVTGTATIETDGAHDLLDRLFDRYWGEAAAARAEERAEMLAADWVRVVLHPERVRRFAN